MDAKLIKKLIYLIISIACGIWMYYYPFPVWVSNSVIAIMVALGINKNLNKISEDGSKIN